MASAELHIKDSYYFEIPKFMWRSRRQDIDDFPDWWVHNDPDFQQWEADRLIHGLEDILTDGPSHAELHEVVHEWEHWQHADHANHGRPLGVYLEMQHARTVEAWRAWQKQQDEEGQLVNEDRPLGEFLEQVDLPYEWFSLAMAQPNWPDQWQQLRQQSRDIQAYDAQADWSQEKVEHYNSLLHGKVLIPQPFGTLRNAYEKESGFAISRFMVIELLVALILALVLTWLARRMTASDRPAGRLWNMLEAVLLFIRNEIARPAIGKHDGDRFVPVLWTLFLFILGCNLMGILPWLGAPTGSFSVTLGLAVVTLLTGMLCGMWKFGFFGYWKNQVPSMHLPPAILFTLGLLIIPMLFAIEVMGLFIKHGVLGVRLLANIVAGHLVLLGIMDLAFSEHGAREPMWWLTAIIALVGSAVFTLLELFVAFLQAYVFTFLSALFIGAAVHRH